MPAPTSLDDRIAVLGKEVDEKLRLGLQRALKTLRVVEDPVGALLPLSPLSLLLLDKIFHSVGEVRPNDNLWSCIGRASSGHPEAKIPGLNLLPRTLGENLDIIRKWTNPIDHADQSVPEPTLEDAENALNLFLRVLRWFYCEYDRGPRLSTLYATEIPESAAGPVVATSPEEGTRRAIVIGISAYADETIPDLKYAAEDARAFAGLLGEVGRFPTGQIAVLADEEATLKNIKRVLADLRRAAPEDLVVLYFAGHGCADVCHSTGQGDDRLSWKYLVPHDAELDYLEETALSMEELQRRFSSLPCRRLVIFLDSCYSGAGERSIAAVGARGVFSDTLLEELAGEGRLVLAASQASELAFEQDELQHGLFTYYLLRGLRGEADPGARGVITVDQLFGYLADRVPREAERFGGRQHPLLKGRLGLEIPLAFVPATVRLPAPTPAPPPRPEALRQAETHCAAGRYAEAIQLLQEYLPRAGKNSGEVQRWLGQSLQASGDLERALAAYQAAVELEPHHPEAHLGLAECRLEEGCIEAAIDACRHALELDPDSGAFLFKIRFRLEQQLAQDPDEPRSLLYLGQIRCLQGQTGMALENLRHAIELWPGDELEKLERPLRRQASFFALRQHPCYPELLALLDHRLQTLAEYRALLARGRAALADQDLAAAQAAFEGGLQLLPEAPEARQELFQVASAREAVAHLQKAAQEILAAGDHQEALTLLERALALDRTAAGIALLRQQVQAAAALAQQLQEGLQQARDCESGGDFATAVALLDRLLELAPDRPEIQAHRQRLEEELRRRQQGQELLTRAAACEAREEWEEALDRLSAAAELLPGDPLLEERRAALDRRLRQRHLETFRAGPLPGELAQRWMKGGGEIADAELTGELARIACLPVDLAAVRAEIKRAYTTLLDSLRERDRQVDQGVERARGYIAHALFAAARREVESIRALNPHARQLPALQRSLQREEELYTQLQNLQSRFEAGDFQGVVAAGRASPGLLTSSGLATQLFQAAQNRLRLGQDLERDLGIVRALLEQDQWSPAFCLALCMLRASRYRDAKEEIAATLASLQERISAAEQQWAQSLPEDMVLVPAGYFVAGSGKGSAPPSPSSQAYIFVDCFALDRHPVTNRAYRQFLESVAPEEGRLFAHPEQPARKSHRPAGWETLTGEDDDKPVVGVDWYDAYAFARWKARRLPTECEWEKAGFWDPRANRARRYPWGDQFAAECCNSAGLGLDGPTAAGWLARGAGYYGALDICGNVWEWCADWYTTDYLGKALVGAPLELPPGTSLGPRPEEPWAGNPGGPPYGDGRVVRGGSWLEADNLMGPSLRSRAYPSSRSRALGFRCALSPAWVRTPRGE